MKLQMREAPAAMQTERCLTGIKPALRACTVCGRCVHRMHNTPTTYGMHMQRTCPTEACRCFPANRQAFILNI